MLSLAIFCVHSCLVGHGVVALPYILQQRQDANCSQLQVVIARGTGEPTNPTYGVVVGDPLFVATQELYSLVTGYAVNYPATFGCDSPELGINDTLAHLASSSSACPYREYALIGYSQGAEVMHGAAAKINPSLYTRIIALVMFGDPGSRGPNSTSPVTGRAIPPFPDILAQKLKENCAFGDPVCSNNGTDPVAHLSYDYPNTSYISDSAAYIFKQFQTNGQSGPSPSVNGPGTGDNSQALSSLAALLGGPTTITCPSATPVPKAISSIEMSAADPRRFNLESLYLR